MIFSLKKHIILCYFKNYAYFCNPNCPLKAILKGK